MKDFIKSITFPPRAMILGESSSQLKTKYKKFKEHDLMFLKLSFYSCSYLLQAWYWPSFYGFFLYFFSTVVIFVRVLVGWVLFVSGLFSLFEIALRSCSILSLRTQLYNYKTYPVQVRSLWSYFLFHFLWEFVSFEHLLFHYITFQLFLVK